MKPLVQTPLDVIRFQEQQLKEKEEKIQTLEAEKVELNSRLELVEAVVEEIILSQYT